MTLDEWIDTFKPIANPIEDERIGEFHYGENGKTVAHGYETFGQSLEIVRRTPMNLLWTLLDVDGDLILSPGYAYVNRMGYFICSVPWTGLQIDMEVIYFSDGEIMEDES